MAATPAPSGGDGAHDLRSFDVHNQKSAEQEEILTEFCNCKWNVNLAPVMLLRTMRGTSMATPLIAGSAALVRQYFLSGFYPGGSAAAANQYAPSGALVKAVLLGGAAGMDGFESDTGLPLAPPPSFRQGFGRVDLGRSLPLQVAAIRQLSALLKAWEDNSLKAKQMETLTMTMPYPHRPVSADNYVMSGTTSQFALTQVSLLNWLPGAGLWAGLEPADCGFG